MESILDRLRGSEFDTPDIREPLLFPRSGRLLRPPADPAPRVSYDIHWAATFADKYAYVFGDSTAKLTSYNDIRDVETTRFYSDQLTSSRRAEIVEWLGQITRVLYQDVETAIGGRHDDDVVTLITGDLYHVAMWRAAFGVTPGFWEDIFEILKHGCAAFGWIGEYPTGQLVVCRPRG